MKMRDACRALLALMPLVCAPSVNAQPAPSQAAAVPPTAANSPAPTQALGRLFYTPAQRAALDDMRRRPQAAIVPEQTTALPPAPEYVTLNGIVRRSDGATTIWLNDKQVRGRESEEGLRISPARRASTPNHVTVVVPQTGHAVDLKVGQQLEVNSGAVKERYRAPPRPRPPAEATAPKAPTEPAAPAQRSGRDKPRDPFDPMDRPAAAATPSSAPAAKGNVAPKS